MVFSNISSPSIQGLNNIRQKLNEEIVINTRTPVSTFVFFFSWWQTVRMFLKNFEFLIAQRTWLDKFKRVTWCVLILFWFCNLVSTLLQVSWLRPASFVTIIFIISTVTADHYLPKVNKINHKAMFWKVVLRLLSWLLTDLCLMVYLFLLILLLFFMTGVRVLITISSFIF